MFTDVSGPDAPRPSRPSPCGGDPRVALPHDANGGADACIRAAMFTVITRPNSCSEPLQEKVSSG